jgi:hypothetical protein
MRLLLLLLWGCCCQWAWSQEYLPLPVDDAEWTQLHKLYGNGNSADYPAPTAVHYSPYSDTLIQGISYTSLYASTGTAFQLDSAYYVGAYRSEGAKSWFWEKGADTALLYTDFSLETGDTVDLHVDCTEWPLCPVFLVASKTLIKLEDGVERRSLSIHLELEEGQSMYVCQWIEGIGSTLGFLNQLECVMQSFLPVDPQCSYSLLCYHEYGQLLYTDPENFEGQCYVENAPIGSTDDQGKSPIFNLYPNPASNVVVIDLIGTGNLVNQPFQLYASTGELVLTGTIEGQNRQLDISTLNAGIYTLLLHRKGTVSIGRFIKQ